MIDYVDIGQGEELLFIHGLGTQKELWKAQLPLSEKYRLIIVELRGHGNSVEVDDLTVETFAQDVLDVLDYLNVRQVHICGLSLGGMVAQEIYKQARERVKSLILCNTTFYIPSVLGEMLHTSTKEMIAQVGYKKFQETSIRTCLYDYEDDENLELASQAFNIREDSYLKTTQAAIGRNYLMTLLNCESLLIISSQEDQVTPIQNAIVMNQLIPTSKLVILKQAGHLSNIEKADEFNQIIDQHLMKYV